MRDDLRLIEAALLQSSINLTCIVLFLVIGLGIGGLKHAPLNLMMKKRPPKKLLAHKILAGTLKKILPSGTEESLILNPGLSTV